MKKTLKIKNVTSFVVDDVLAFSLLSMIYDVHLLDERETEPPDFMIVEENDSTGKDPAEVAHTIIWKFSGENPEYTIPRAVWRYCCRRICEPYELTHSISPAQLNYAIEQALFIDERGPFGSPGHASAIDMEMLHFVVESWVPVVPFERQDSELVRYAFVQAAKVVRALFERLLIAEAGHLWTKAFVRSCDKGEPVLVLGQTCKWEYEVSTHLPHVKFVVMRNGSHWLVCSVPVAFGETGRRKLFPREWSRVRLEVLRSATGIPDILLSKSSKRIVVETEASAINLANLANRSV